MSRYSSSSFRTSSSSFKTKSLSSDKQDPKQNIANVFGVNLKGLNKPGHEAAGKKKEVKTTSKSSTSKTSIDKRSVELKGTATKAASKTSSAPIATTTSKSNTATATDAISQQRMLKSTRINIDLEKIPDFAVARPRILPVLKPKSWEASTKDMLKKIDPKKTPELLFFPVMTLPMTSLGYTLAIVNEEGSLQYILRSYLEAWNISEKVLKDVAIRNLEHRLENRGTRLWKRSKAGVYYLDNLGSVSASVILLPQFLDGLEIEDGDPVVVAPSGDICLVGGAKSDTQLCIIGEIALQFSKDPQHFDIKPLRFSKNRFHEYAPKIYAQEQNVPQSLDEVRKIRLRLKPLKLKRQK
ncbi:uncharacterized protein LOC110231241 [Exaiptasia diaphana]|uniref:Uncharacterized protein n=1 Tax=Exaiptasia diaphana TaxID=2652724 RepID=A0A913WP03_EXADI|nr:uncharacterized protein LOC110231241 [Exaiptasia diaphana]KXJ19104.1 hypothetical protein AC249_AIPGENE11773 [Exaiptasia diaphana]